MNSVHSQRLLAVLEDTAAGLRLMSLVTPEVLAAAHQLGASLGEDVPRSLQQHAAELAQLPPDFAPDRLLRTSSAVLRALKKSPVAEAVLCGLPDSRSPAAAELVGYFERLCVAVRRRLGTTVEEDEARRQQHAALAERCERAGAERLQLKHRLKLARLERAKQTGELQAAHEAAAAELEELHSSTATEKAAAEEAAAVQAEVDKAASSEEEAALGKQLDEARAALAALCAEANSVTAAARRARKHAQHDCEAAVGEYDAELGARQSEHDAAQAAYTELQGAIQRANQEAEELRAERLEHEEALRVAAEARRRAELRALRDEAAAYAIQNAWKGFRRFKAAEAKKAAKGGGKGGGKGGVKAATGRASSGTKGARSSSGAGATAKAKK